MALMAALVYRPLPIAGTVPDTIRMLDLVQHHWAMVMIQAVLGHYRQPSTTAIHIQAVLVKIGVREPTGRVFHGVTQTTMSQAVH